MTTAPPHASAPRRAAFVFIFITVLLDCLALGIIIPVLPKLVISFLGGDTAQAAHIYGLFGTVWALMQFIFAPLMGSLSDRVGRRPVILLSNVGLGLDYMLMAMAPSLAWLFVGRVVSGITAASISTASAYIADVTPPERRAGSFGMLGAAFGLGFVVGPAVGGLLGDSDPRLPFWVAGGLSLLNALYGLFVLPESLPPEKRGPFQWSRANPLGSLRLLATKPTLKIMGCVVLLSNLAHEVLPNVSVLYTSYRYGWGPRTVGIMLALVGVCSGVVQAGLVRPVVARLGELRTVTLAMGCGALGFTIYGLAPTEAVYWWGVPTTSLWGLASAAVVGYMSQQLGPQEQGQLQGAFGAVRGVAGLIGPVLFTSVFAACIAPAAAVPLPGAPYLLSASLLLAAACVSAWMVATHVGPAHLVAQERDDVV